ncbi:RHS repeat domain-containing protein [Flectobacillus major]|uniref:RHS repeat domain-containing protein n=1 Tax=Flectobacillus major TaxID=103 RepID=UPI0003FEB763|nr:RHS repeat-associated core domain-containing protein [Flectobacillus major]
MTQTPEQTYRLFDHIHFYLDYKYHIRGGLKGINLDANNNLTNSLFSYKLDYEEDGTYYDGNIRNQYWKSNIDGIQRAYQYNYDGASRIIAATYGSTKTGENYALNNVTYDANGNILSLSRNGKISPNSWGDIDQLAYTYNTNSNKIKAVNDALLLNNPNVGDFRDSSSAENQYIYAQDGSLIFDDNKKISIDWYYLKLPKKITKANGQWKAFIYNAQGKLLQTQTSEGLRLDYVGNLIYENNTLYQINHEEGRVTNGSYEYDINDQAGNLRLSIKDSLGLAKIVTKLDYDPWGMRLKGLDYYNPGTYNKFKTFSGKELHDTFGFNLLSYKYRFHDPILGRFISVDPLSEQYSYNSPFAFAENKLGLGVEYEGLELVPYNLGNTLWKEAGFSHNPSQEENVDMAHKGAVYAAKTTVNVLATAVLAEVGITLLRPLLSGTVVGEVLGVATETKNVSRALDAVEKLPEEISQRSMYSKMGEKELLSSQKSYTNLVKEHQIKLEEFKADPIGKTSPEKMAQAQKGGDNAIRKVIEGRIKSLEQQIRKQEGELKKINQEIENRKK